MKAGTTSLYQYLRAHPQVFMPTLKEVDFFTAELNWQRGWRWYERQFAAARDEHRAVGEASTSYTKFPRYEGVAARIGEALPQARLVYLVRDPVARIRSHYQHNVTIGHERHDLDTALRKDPAYLDYSRYALQIEKYLDHFPREQILVLTSEALHDDRRETVQRVLRYIGVDPDAEIPGLEQEFYRSEERAAYGAVVTGARDVLRKAFPSRTSLWRGMFIPDRVKKKLARKASPATAAVAVSDAARSFIHQELSDEVARLAPYVSGDLSHWGIS